MKTDTTINFENYGTFYGEVRADISSIQMQTKMEVKFHGIKYDICEKLWNSGFDFKIMLKGDLYYVEIYYRNTREFVTMNSAPHVYGLRSIIEAYIDTVNDANKNIYDDIETMLADTMNTADAIGEFLKHSDEFRKYLDCYNHDNPNKQIVYFPKENNKKIIKDKNDLKVNKTSIDNDYKKKEPCDNCNKCKNPDANDVIKKHTEDAVDRALKAIAKLKDSSLYIVIYKPYKNSDKEYITIGYINDDGDVIRVASQGGPAPKIVSKNKVIKAMKLDKAIQSALISAILGDIE